jgi:hypothetical protein
MLLAITVLEMLTSSTDYMNYLVYSDIIELKQTLGG